MTPGRHPGTFPNFETERLRVTDWSGALAEPQARAGLEAVLAAHLTGRVLAPLPPTMQLSRTDEIGRWIDARVAESDVFLVLERAAPQSLLGLMVLADHNEGERRILHLGYLIWEKMWGQGLASELLTGLVATATRIGGLELRAGVAEENRASVRVLEKAGLQRFGAGTIDGAIQFTRRF